MTPAPPIKTPMKAGENVPRQARVKSQSGVYHIIWRGANRQEIFHDEKDFRFFLQALKRFALQADLKVYAWCLMNNHIHLLVKEGTEPISVTMKRIGVSFVGYYNLKYQTNGHLFQDRFKSEAVESSLYFRRVVRYIHQNPVKAGMVKRVDEWKWSSCLGYYNREVFPQRLLSPTIILRMFSTDLETARAEFKEFNETNSNDQCLEGDTKKRLTDDEARALIKEKLGSTEIVHVKSLPRVQRDEVLRQLKLIPFISQRQLARILGISPKFVHGA